ncbi:MAG: hypothetical protein ABJF23_10775 [Bryobacteraceae bacterium]
MPPPTELPKDLSDADIQGMVEGLFIQEDGDFSLDRLKLVGRRAIPFLIGGLQDQRTATTIFHEINHLKSPFERICLLLEILDGPPEAAVALAKYLDNPTKRFREVGALGVGNIAAADCIGPVTKALADKDGSVRGYTMIGVYRALKENRGERVFFDGIFSAIAGGLNHKNGDAPKILVSIDRERAIPILIASENLSIANPQLQHILAALNLARYPIPLMRLLPLMHQLESTADRYPGCYQYAQALISYAHNPDAETKSKLRLNLASSVDIVKECAAWA